MRIITFLKTQKTFKQMTLVSKLHKYYFCADVIDQDDNGGDQVSLYKCTFETEKYLTPTEAVKHAETFEGWEVHLFGHGEKSRVGTALVEYTALENSVNKSWESVEPISICWL